MSPQEALQTGSKVVTAGGIHGIIRDVKPTYFVVEVSNGVSLRIDKPDTKVTYSDLDGHWAKAILDENKAQRHIRGGIATRKKYKGEG